MLAPCILDALATHGFTQPSRDDGKQLCAIIAYFLKEAARQAGPHATIELLSSEMQVTLESFDAWYVLGELRGSALPTWSVPPWPGPTS